MPRSTRSARKPPDAYHHGDLSRALLDEALDTIRTGGVDALTLREIGARLGVSRTALYRHFADKRALLAAVATEGFRMLRKRLIAAWEEGKYGDAAFHAMGVAYVHFAVDNASHYRVMFGGFVDPDAHDPELADEAQRAFRALVNAVAELQRAGIFLRDDTLLMARHTWALVHGIALLAIDGLLPDKAAVDELMRYSFQRLRTGILTKPG